MDVNALQKLGTGGVGEASKGNLAHPEAYLPLDAQPYLSMLDYQIICDQGSGSVHSKEYGLSEQEFQIRQSQAVQKILHLSSQINKNIFNQRSHFNSAVRTGISAQRTGRTGTERSHTAYSE